ncbi:MAG TPA: baseplate J/gp47 family protein [Candidatus Dormibacteraeota bacterium]
MKTLAKLLYVEADEEITDLVDRLRDLSLEDEVTFVVPERARSLQSAMSFRLLKRYADSYGKKVNLVSADPRLQAMALEAGFTTFPTMAAYDHGTQVHQPALIDEPDVPVYRPIESGRAIASTAGVATLERPKQVTSAPPKKAAPGSSLPSGPPLRVYRPYLIGAGVLVLLGLLAGILYLPTASAALIVAGTPIKEDITLNGAPGAQTSGDQFATQAVHASQQQSLPGTATGQKPVAAVAASGNVTFSYSNCFIFCQPIPKGWTVETADGAQKFATQKVASINGTGGNVTVPVVAEAAGAAGNVAAGQISKIQGNGDDSITVSNADPTTGGADARTATVIQQSDIDSVRDAYAKDATQQVQDQLNSKAQGKKIVLVGTGVQASATADHKVGDEVGGFTVTVTVAGDGVVFDDAAVQSLLKSALQRKLPQGTQLTSENTKLTYDVASSSADGHITLNGHASGFYTPVYIQSNIRAKLKGMSPSRAHAFLQTLPNVIDARVTQSPFGLPWLPLFSSRITLHFQEVAGSSSS